jgi:hypothetical protein
MKLLPATLVVPLLVLFIQLRQSYAGGGGAVQAASTVVSASDPLLTGSHGLESGWWAFPYSSLMINSMFF